LLVELLGEQSEQISRSRFRSDPDDKNVSTGLNAEGVASDTCAIVARPSAKSAVSQGQPLRHLDPELRDG
jgi:hypothetical protein